MSNIVDTPQPKSLTLKKRVFKAGGWSLLQIFSVHGLRLGSNLIMTRLLLPDAFGLVAMVSVLIVGFSLFTDVGLNRSIAREPDGDQERFLRVAWVFKVARGVLIALCVLLAAWALTAYAPLFAAEGSVYADPRLPILVALSAIIPILLGLESSNLALVERQLKLHYTAFIEFGAQVTQITAMVIFAWLSPTVWALMAGMIVGPMVKAAASHVAIPGPRMAFVWDQEIAGRLWHYGKWLMVSSTFSFVALNADRIILGGVMTASLFGIFVIAQIWIGATSMVINRLIDQVGFPAISEMIRTRPDDVPRLFRKLQTGIDGMCIIAFLVMFFGGQLLIDLLYTDTYSEAGHYLRLLSLSYLSLRFYSHNTLIMNLGNSKAVMVMSAIRAFSICVLLPLAYHNLGMDFALVVIALNPLVSSFYALGILKPYLGKNQVRLDLLWVIVTLVLAVFVALYA